MMDFGFRIICYYLSSFYPFQRYSNDTDPMIFAANVDGNKIAKIVFDYPIITNQIKIVIESYRHEPAFACQLYGYVKGFIFLL